MQRLKGVTDSVPFSYGRNALPRCGIDAKVDLIGCRSKKGGVPHEQGRDLRRRARKETSTAHIEPLDSRPGN